MQALNVNLSDLTSLQPCIFLAMEFPLHIKRVIVEDKEAALTVVAARVASIENQRATATTGLSMFERLPQGLHGMTAFWRQVNFHQRAYSTNKKIVRSLNILTALRLAQTIMEH